MGKETGIQWADSTLNLMMGCNGCELWNPAKGVNHCYAGTLVERHKGNKGFPLSFAEPTLYVDRLEPALKWKDLQGITRDDRVIPDEYPRIIFLNDMGDAFTEDLPLDWLHDSVKAMAEAPHVWILLTKRPSRMVQFFESFTQKESRGIPVNLWLMTTVTGKASAKRVEILQKLRKMGAQTLGVSYEPAIELVDFRPFLQSESGLDWIIVGGESGDNARPFLTHWVVDVHLATLGIGQAKRVPLFVKQLGANVGTVSNDLEKNRDIIHGGNGYHRMNLKDSHGGNPVEWPEWIPLRREFPELNESLIKVQS